ncbi:MAG: chromosomal replication initiator protein DnaA [Filifactor alocis]|nr:chromosomal replication initiator protein DnaA [Filifactor alocis]
MNVFDLWASIKEAYRTQAPSKHSFDTFIERLDPLTIKNNCLILLADGSFIYETVVNTHLRPLQEICDKQTNRTIKLKIIASIEEMEEDSSEEKRSETFSNNVTLIPKYTFDSFVIGKSNQFAHAACIAVADSPSKAYNPLFIYGGVGLGKTHLMHAIGNHILSKNKDAKILYLSSETFTNELINSIKDDTNEEFRSKYRRDVDVLLIDDIQFIAEKEGTQEEFFHTFNALHGANKQIIISSDRTPKEIRTLEDRLRSRFEMGLIADIQSPDYETRIAILRKKAQAENREVPNDVIEYITKHIKSNIRELEGALTRIFAFADLTKKEINYELAKEALKDIFDINRNVEITPVLIKEKVSHFFSVRVEDFSSKARKREIAYPRQVAMYLCRELTPLSLPKIGSEFGGRDHTTVIHACEKIANEISTDEKTRKLIEQLKKDIHNS